MDSIDKKPLGEQLEGAGVPALPRFDSRDNASACETVRNSLAGRYPSVGSFHVENHPAFALGWRISGCDV